MVGSMIGIYPFYACTSNGLLRRDRCTAHIAAEALEGFIAARAVQILTCLDFANLVTTPVVVPGVFGQARYSTDLRRLDELSKTQGTSPISGRGHTELVKRIRAAQRAVIVRPVSALDGVVTGPGARFTWSRLSRERKAAVLRYLFGAIRIGPSATSRGVFDYSRIEIIPNPL
jgi:hypothetical protein